MKPLPIKNIFLAALLFSVACFFTACTKRDIRPVNSAIDTNKTVIGSIAKIDSLPSFNNPSGVALDAAGNIYVADFGNNLIREITPAGKVSTYAGNGSQGKIDGTGKLAAFNAPSGIAADASGNLFVADAGSDVIRKIAAGGIVTTIAGADSASFANGAGLSAAFFHPVGVAVDAADNVYIADAGNNLIRLLTAGGTVSTFAGIINTGASTQISPFNNPTGVAVDASGNVYVANYLDNNIALVNKAGAVSTYAGPDTLFAPGAVNGPVMSAAFYYPNSVALDAANNLYVADGVNNLIRKITPAGTVSTFAGSGVAGAVDSTGVNASFNGPAGLAVDDTGDVYVADSNNNLIRKITPAGVVTTIAGNGLPGSKNGLAIAYRNRRKINNKPHNIFNLLYRQKRN